MDKNCIACGMPMTTEEDFAMEDTTKAYCCYCCREDGSMQSYDEKLATMSAFITKTRDLDEVSAENMAKGIMEKLPAWSNQ